MLHKVAFVFTILVGAAAIAADPPKRPTLDEYKAGKAKAAENKTATAAQEAKMAAVNKVVSMLDDLQAQVIAEGEKEAATYDKFACFCKDMTKEKTKAIKKGKDQKAELSAEIEKLSKERDDLDDKIAGLNSDIEKAEKDMAKLQATSDKALAVYEKNAADLSAAVYAVTEAIKVLKSSKSPSLLQFQSVSKNVETALMLADALGFKSAKRAGQIFLQGAQAPEVEMENYKFHSSGIIETLEGLMKDFQKTKNDVDADEVQRVQEFNMEKQKLTDYLKAKNLELKESKEARDQKTDDIAENSQELTTVSATLLDDQQYLSELSAGCSDKAKTWDQRSKMRVQELTAITEAMDIVKATVVTKTSAATIRFAQMGSTMHTADAVANDEGAMMAIEAEAEDTEASGPVAFLQKRQSKSSSVHAVAAKLHAPENGDMAKQMIVTMLRTTGSQLKSTLLLSLATQISGDPFAKIKKLIQELIERLLQEAANEANQKGWCDKALADAKQKRDMADDKIAELNAQMGKLEATISKLAEELEVLTKEIKELSDAQAEAQKMRGEEKAENKETVYEAKIGLEATNMAIQILSRFYATAAKAKVDLSLTQGPFDDAPDAGFKNGEAYTAAGSDSGGIVGMLEVIASDFTRTIEETQASEKAAEKDHLQFMTESSMSLAEKNMAGQQKTKYKDEATDKHDSAEGNLQAQNKILVTSIKELMELQQACIDTGMSYADRVAMREQEIASLKKALCILGAYAQYGPDGLADAC
jgi:chromosome segregation ATPase